MSFLVDLSLDGVTPEESAPDPERVIAGDPRFLTWNVEQTDAGLYAGVWQSTPGKWRIFYEEWEYCRILSGVSVVTEEGGVPRRLAAGDSLIVRPGFRGTWEVVATTRKEYVIYF